MEKKLTKFLRKTVEYSFYLWVFILPWQTKLILRAAETNFQEIALYASHFFLLLIIIGFFIYKLRRPVNGERISLLWLALTGLEVGIFISFFFAPDQFLAFYHYVLFLMGVGLFYLLREGSSAYSYEEVCFDKILAIYWFLASIFMQALLGIYQFLGQQAAACKYLGLAAHDSGALGAAVIEAASGRWLRAYGGMDHPNIFGGVLALVLIISGYLLAEKKMIRSKREAVQSILLFIFYFVGLFALFFTFSRAAWLAYALGLIGLLVTFIFKKDRWVLGRFIALIFFSAVMMLIFVYPYRDLLQVRVEGGTRLEQKSVNERIEYLGQAKDLIRSDWLVGVGTGNYTVAVAARDVVRKEAWVYQPVHNAFLLLWSEAGVFSLICFLLFLFLLIKKERRESFAAAVFIGLLVLMLFDHWLLSLPFGVILLFFILGLL